MALYGPMTIGEAIEEAFENIGFAPSGLTAEHVESAQRSIKRMLTSWNNDSVNFWKVLPNQTHTQTVEEQTWTLPAGTVDILDMAVLRDNYSTPMLTVTRSDWFAIPDKAVTTGMANRIWVERDLDPPVAHIYPMAENSSDVLVYDALVQFNDSSVLKLAPDIRQTWNDAFIAGLEWYLAGKFCPQRLMEKSQKYGGPGTGTPSGSSGLYQIGKWANRERGDTVMLRHKSLRSRR